MCLHCRYSRARALQGAEQDNAAAALLFAALDTERTELISWREFKELVTVLKVQWEREDTPSFLERRHPRLYNSNAWQSVIKTVKNPYFEWSMYSPCTLMLSAFISVD